MSKTHYEFKPWNVGRWIIWGLFALLMVVAPKLFTSSLSHTMGATSSGGAPAASSGAAQ